MNKSRLLVFLFLFIVPIAYAAQLSSGDNLVIVYPKISYVTHGTPYNFIIQVFNSSGILLDGTEVECNMNLYNNKGVNLLASVMDYNSNKINYTIDTNILNEFDTYSYNVWCNESDRGGYASDSFEVTSTGKQNTKSIGIEIAIVFIIIMILVFYLYMSITFGFGSLNENGIFRLLFYLLAFWMMLIPANFAANLSELLGNPNIYYTVNIFYTTIMYVNIIVTLYFILWIIIQLFQKISIKRKI